MFVWLARLAWNESNPARSGGQVAFVCLVVGLAVRAGNDIAITGYVPDHLYQFDNAPV